MSTKMQRELNPFFLQNTKTEFAFAYNNTNPRST